MKIPIAVRCLITLVFIVIVIALSLEPGVTQSGDSYFSWLVSSTPTFAQKVLHVIAYGMIAILWLWTLESMQPRNRRTIVAVALAITLGISVEILQTVVPGRFGTLFDVFLNAIGASGGVMVVRIALEPWPGEPDDNRG